MTTCISGRSKSVCVIQMSVFGSRKLKAVYERYTLNRNSISEIAPVVYEEYISVRNSLSEMAPVQESKTCPNCYASYDTPNSTVCWNCGVNLVAQSGIGETNRACLEAYRGVAAHQFEESERSISLGSFDEPASKQAAIFIFIIIIGVVMCVASLGNMVCYLLTLLAVGFVLLPIANVVGRPFDPLDVPEDPKICPNCMAAYESPESTICWNCEAGFGASSEIEDTRQTPLETYLGVEVRQFREGEWSISIGRCMVCKFDVKDTEEATWCPRCGTIAHTDHFLEWLHVKHSCPVCKEHLNEEHLRQ